MPVRLRPAVLLLVLAACGGGAAPTDPPASEPAPAEPAPPTDASAAADDAGILGEDAGPAAANADAAAAPSACGPIPSDTFATTKSEEGPSCTLFRPTTMAANGFRHPVIVWGNGTGAVTPVYEAAFQQWASQGFVVAAAQTSNGQGAGTALIACLDHVTKTYGSSVCDRAGASGHSQGGGGAIMAGRDARIFATAPVQPYIQQGYGGFDNASIATQTSAAVMLLLSGSADDNAVPSIHQKPVFDTTNIPVFWATLQGGDHYLSAYGLSGYRDIVQAWFRLHLMGDPSEHAKFYGPSCTYCTNPKWTVQRRGL